MLELLALELAHQIRLSVEPRVGHVDVAHLAARFLGDIAAVRFNPVAIAQIVFSAHWLDDYFAHLVIHRWVCSNGERNGLAAQAFECSPWILGAVDRQAINGQQVLAFLDIDAKLLQWVARISIPRRAGHQVLESVDVLAVWSDGYFPVNAKHANTDVWSAATVTTVVVGMTNVELADHLADDVTDIFAAVGVIHHCQVPLADAVPINAVHVRVIEIVAEDAPCIPDHLLPFMLGIDFREHGLVHNGLAG